MLKIKIIKIKKTLRKETLRKKLTITSKNYDQTKVKKKILWHIKCEFLFIFNKIQNVIYTIMTKKNPKKPEPQNNFQKILFIEPSDK